MSDKQPESWGTRYKSLLGLLIQTAAALLGLYIMFTAISSGSDRPWLYTAAIMMMGLPFASTFGELVHTFHQFMEEMRRAAKPPSDEEPSS